MKHTTILILSLLCISCSIRAQRLTTANVDSYFDIDKSMLYPSEDLPEGQIIMPGIYHNDEVLPDMQNGQWLGLFVKEGTYYVDTARINLSKVFDPLFDEEYEKTGWSVAVNEADSCLLLFRDLKIPINSNVAAISIPNTQLANNKVFPFSLLGKKYELYPLIDLSKHDSTEMGFYHYRMVMSSYATTKPLHTLIIAGEMMYDLNNFQLFFIGDLDQDGLPDMIMNTSSHYNKASITLYLSSYGSNKQLMVPIAVHNSYGC